MPLKFIGGILAAIGMLMIFTYSLNPAKSEEIAMKQLFYGIMLVIGGLLLIFYSPI